MFSNMKSLKVVVAGTISAIVLVAATVPRVGINNGLLQSNLDGGLKCITNLACLQVGSIDSTSITSTSITTSNLNSQNINTSNLNLTTINNNPVSTLCNVQLLEVFDLKTNAVVSAATNRYWMDMAHTNSHGQVDIYATITPTNDIQLELPTNGFRGGLLSVNVLARGANRTIFFPIQFSAFNTNDAGMALKGSRYVLVLTNGNEFRFTIQSNDTYSVMTKTFGQ
jgi:hypothetical protein